MRATTVSAHWTGNDLDFIATNRRGNEVAMGGEGVPPTHMLLMGLAGCMGMDVLSILQKKRQDVSDVEVKVTGHSKDDHPRPMEVIELAFTVKGSKVTEKAVERAIQLSVDTYCPVGKTLQFPVDIQTSFVIETATE